MTTEINIDGVTYRSTPEVANNCTGCIFRLDDRKCDIANETDGCSGIIWLKVEDSPITEKLYSLADYTEALEEWIAAASGTSRDEFIRKYLERKHAPEYQTYLELKERFASLNDDYQTYLNLKEKFENN